MRKWILRLGLLVAFLAGVLYAQDLTGDWQGSIKVGARDLRLVVHIVKDGMGDWKATLYSIDQGPDPIPVSSVTLQGSTLKMTADAIRGSYEGTVSTGGAAITGTWTQGGKLPLELRRATKETAWQRDKSPHTAQFVTVDKNVKLEVLDWGGSGRPLVLLAGLGNSAHVFDDFAPKLTTTCHVYGVTRRGFGESSAPEIGYSADRLGDDVLAIIDALKLVRPVLAGHSIAGEELSSIGSRHPEKVAGLIYLDAGYPYAYYDASRGNVLLDAMDVQKKLDQLVPLKGPADQRPLMRELLETSLPQLEKVLKQSLKDLEGLPVPPQPPSPPGFSPALAVITGQQKYTEIRVPVLAIYALPHAGVPVPGNDPEARKAAEARDLATTGAQAKAFEAGVPSARVVRLPNANHYVFRSNEADVLREMNAFLGGLPRVD